MEFLYMLEKIRIPVLNEFMLLITTLGEETAFLVAALVVFWCVDKYKGYFVLTVGLMGSLLSQFMKLLFRIPRPWVLDPTFTIVKSAREAATGYSFPSGHTQSAATVFGTLAAWIGKTWVTVGCILLIALVGFSRMYLGVHTPLDVGVSFITGAMTVLGFLYLFRRAEGSRKGKIGIGLIALVLALTLLAYVSFAPVTERNIAEFDAHGVENAWKLLGTLSGMLLAWWVDDRYTHFETKAVWWAQIGKLLIGLGLVMAIRLGMKPVLNLIFPGAAFSGAIRYFLMAAVGGALWPMTFGFWSRLGKKE